MKKVVIGVTAAALWIVCVALFVGFSMGGASGTDHQFTVLTVKEDVVKDYNSMPVFKDIALEAGVDVHWIYNTSAQYANNTDPVGTKGIDAIYHSGFSNLSLYNYGKRGRIVAIDQYLDSMPNFAQILNERPDIREALKSPDGHIYSLPRVEEMGLKAYPNILFINKNWIGQLIDANDLPESVKLTKDQLVDGLDLSRDQFGDILRKFLEHDFAGGGNTVPFTFVSGNWQGNESDFIASFGVPENREHKTVVNNKITFTIEDPNWLEAVKVLHDWYSEGLIPTSAFDSDENSFLAKGQNGAYGAFYWWEKNTVLNEELRDDYIIVLPLRNGNDLNAPRYVGISNEQEVEKGECVILSTCSDVEGLLGYFDKFFLPDYSAQLNYGSISSGAFAPNKVGGKLIPNDDHGGQSADEFRMRNAPYGVVYLPSTIWETSVQMESRAELRLSNLIKYVTPYLLRNLNGQAVTVSSIPNLNYTEEELNELSTAEFTLSNNIASWYIRAVTGSSTPSESDWQSLLSTNRNQLEAVKRINQAAYDRYIEATKPKA